jgi:hypothetical protein
MSNACLTGRRAVADTRRRIAAPRSRLSVPDPPRPPDSGNWVCFARWIPPAARAAPPALVRGYRAEIGFVWRRPLVRPIRHNSFSIKHLPSALPWRDWLCFVHCAPAAAALATLPILACGKLALFRTLVSSGDSASGPVGQCLLRQLALFVPPVPAMVLPTPTPVRLRSCRGGGMALFGAKAHGGGN